MSTQQITQPLERLFSRQLSAASELMQILSEENKALLDRDYERTQQVIAAKQEKTAEIESISQEQIKLLASVDLPYSREGLDKAIQSASKAEAAKLNQLRSELESIMEKCQEQNLVNNQVVTVNSQSAKTALAILRGQFSTEELTYGSSGQPINEKPASPITKA